MGGEQQLTHTDWTDPKEATEHISQTQEETNVIQVKLQTQINANKFANRLSLFFGRFLKAVPSGPALPLLDAEWD